MPKRLASATVVCLLAIVMLGADSSSRFNRLGHNMICVCSCNQVLLECNHVGCPDSDRMIGELRQQLGSGGSDTSILNWFAAKYGPTVLAAPIRGGFDNAAWIAPAVVFFLATIGTGFLIRIWRSRTVLPMHPAAPLSSDAMRDRVRRETQI